MQSQQVANSQFCSTGQGHPFKLRNPLAKVTARKCADCAIDIFQHSRGEVQDVDALKILDIVADTKVYMCVYMCEREIERERVCVCMCAYIYICVCACVYIKSRNLLAKVTTRKCVDYSLDVYVQRTHKQ